MTHTVLRGGTEPDGIREKGEKYYTENEEGWNDKKEMDGIENCALPCLRLLSTVFVPEILQY